MRSVPRAGPGIPHTAIPYTQLRLVENRLEPSMVVGADRAFWQGGLLNHRFPADASYVDANMQ